MQAARVVGQSWQQLYQPVQPLQIPLSQSLTLKLPPPGPDTSSPAAHLHSQQLLNLVMVGLVALKHGQHLLVKLNDGLSVRSNDVGAEGVLQT